MWTEHQFNDLQLVRFLSSPFSFECQHVLLTVEFPGWSSTLPWATLGATNWHQICMLNNLSQLSTVLKLAYHLWTLGINIIPLRFALSPYESPHHGAFCDTISIISRLSQLQVHFDSFEFTIHCTVYWLEGMVATEDFLLQI